MPIKDFGCDKCDKIEERFYFINKEPTRCDCGGNLSWVPSGNVRAVEIGGDYWYERVLNRAAMGNHDAIETVKNIGYQLPRTPRDRHDLQKLEKETGSMRVKFGDDKPWI